MKLSGRGITLIELLVVIALLGILLGLAAPSFTDMIARQRVRSSADALVTDIAFTRSEAVARRQPVRIAFDTLDGADCYAIYVSAGGRCGCAGCDATATELRTARLPASDGVRLTSAVTAGGQRELQFDALQAAPDSPNYDVNLTHSRGPQLRARIGALGQVRVCSPNGSVSGVSSTCP